MKGYHTKAEFLAIAKLDDADRVTFEMPIDFSELMHNTGGIQTLNDVLDDFVTDGYLLMDISYEPVRVDEGAIIVRVNADASEFLHQPE